MVQNNAPSNAANGPDRPVQENADAQNNANPDSAEGGDALEAARQSLVDAHREEASRKAQEEKSEPPPGRLWIKVERENIVQQSLAGLCSVPCVDLLARHLTIEFDEEQGLDAGGIARDWFDTLGQKLVVEAENGDGHLMVLADNTLFPRPYDERFNDLLAIGRLAGLAVWFGISLPVPIGSVVCKFLLDENIGPRDLQRLDPDFFQFRVQPVLRSGGVEALEAALCEPLMFVSAATELRSSKELCPGGKDKRVTEENKDEYIKLLCEHYLCGDMTEQIKVFLQGFWDICPKDYLICSGVTYRELALLISGYSQLDPEQWRAHTNVSSTAKAADSDEVVEWFWELVKEMSDAERAKLLHFVTGSSNLPPQGFPGISPQFNISVQSIETDHLPHAHTCGNQLVLPRYTNKELLAEKMRTALANDQGFGFA
jgi:E3 ubiquitin-protein ligase HUWE1